MKEPIESILRGRLDAALCIAAAGRLDDDAFAAFRRMIIGGAIVALACAVEQIAREEGAEAQTINDLHAAACRLGLESIGAVGRDFGKMQ